MAVWLLYEHSKHKQDNRNKGYTNLPMLKLRNKKTLTINQTPQTDNPESRVKGNCKEDPPVFRYKTDRGIGPGETDGLWGRESRVDDGEIIHCRAIEEPIPVWWRVVHWWF